MPRERLELLICQKEPPSTPIEHLEQGYHWPEQVYGHSAVTTPSRLSFYRWFGVCRRRRCNGCRWRYITLTDLHGLARVAHNATNPIIDGHSSPVAARRIHRLRVSGIDYISPWAR